MLIMMCVPAAYAADTSFTDVTDANQKAAVQKMLEAGLISGYEDGTFRPNAPVLRSELARMINQVFGFKDKVKNVFSDVKEDAWFFNEICIAKKAGYISGYEDGTFRPSAYVTREQACVMINNIMQFEPSQAAIVVKDKVSDWAKTSVDSIIEHNIMPLETNQTFRATQNITRGELCVALAKFLTDNSADNAVMTKEELLQRLTRVSNQLEKDVLPQVSSDNVKKIVQAVIDNMKAYEADTNYDFKAPAQKVYKMYQNLSSSEKSELTTLILSNISLDDIAALRQFFFSES